MVSTKRLQSIVCVGTMAIFTSLLLNAPLRSEGRPLPQQSAPTVSEKKAPELTGSADKWLNSEGKSLALYGKDGLLARNQAVVLTFWTHQCINCKRTIPFWNGWAQKYRGKNVAVISVHTPETQEERVFSNVRRFVQKKGITFPVVADNAQANWDAYHIEAWPTTILLDKTGIIRARWEGELDYENSGEYKKVERMIEQLRQEK